MRVRSTTVLGVGVAFCALLAGCQDVKASGTQAKPDDKSTLAKVDDVVITVSDFQDRINKQSPYVRSRYNSLEQKRQFLDTLVKFEVLVKEAQKRGFDKDPDVQRTMKQVMIEKMVQAEFSKPVDISDNDARAYYDAHPEEFNQPPTTRVAEILVKDKATADKVLKDARAVGVDNESFRKMVAQYSIDLTTKDRGGDLRYFDEKSRDVPREIVAAAFKLETIGENSAPIKTPQGWVVLKLTGRRKAQIHPFDEAKTTIKIRLGREQQESARTAFIDNLRDKAHVEVDEGKLAKVQVLGVGNGFPGPGVPPPGAGEFHPGAGGMIINTPQTPGVPAGSQNIALPPAVTPPAADPTAAAAATTPAANPTSVP